MMFERLPYTQSTRHRVIVSRHSAGEMAAAAVIVVVLIVAAYGLLPFLIIGGLVIGIIFAFGYALKHYAVLNPNSSASTTPPATSTNIPVWVTSQGVCSWCGLEPKAHVDASGVQINLDVYHGLGGNTP